MAQDGDERKQKAGGGERPAQNSTEDCFSHTPDGSDSKGLPALGVWTPLWWGLGPQPAPWLLELEGTVCDQGQLLFLEEILSTIFHLGSVEEKRGFELLVYSHDPKKGKKQQPISKSLFFLKGFLFSFFLTQTKTVVLLKQMWPFPLWCI